MYSVSSRVVESMVLGLGLKLGIDFTSGILMYPVVGRVPALVSTAYCNVIPAVESL